MERYKELRKKHRESNWGWKLATSPDDVMNFLNGSGAYTVPVAEARIGAIWKGTHSRFYIFYRRTSPPSGGGWAWKLATDPDDVRNFLSGSGSYAHPVRDAQIAAFRKGGHNEFYVFYQGPDSDETFHTCWAWKLANNASDAMDFLNGTGAYQHPVTVARIAALNRDGRDELYIFYQRAVRGEPINNWYWKLATTTADAQTYVNGKGAYRRSVDGFDMSALWKGTHLRFYIFANQGTRIWLQKPLENERFVQGEPITLHAVVTSDKPVDGSALTWTSNLDGFLGKGFKVTIANLTPGVHTIEASGYGVQSAISLRVFTDLGQFYLAPPSNGELARIKQDFKFNWLDGNGVDEQWATYPEVFDQQSTDPSKQVIYAKLDVLRHQCFNEPLPFTGGKTIYEHLRTYVHTLNLRLNCTNNSGGGGSINLNRSLSVWDTRQAGTQSCKNPFSNPQLHPYVNPLYLLVHECRHNEPGEPGHVFINGSQRDPYLEEGSGHAWAALYTMWVYKYGQHDPPDIKDWAKIVAKSLLTSRFASTPIHSNPKVKAIIDELLES